MTTNTPKVTRIPTRYSVPTEKPVKQWTGDDIAAKVIGDPQGFEDILEVTRLMGDSAANGDKNDPVVVTGRSELALRRLVERFGFERLPQTYGELHGFLDYALHLRGASTEDIAQYPAQAETWRKSVLEICREYFPERVEGTELFMAGDMAGLAKHHRENNTMYRLGQAYREEIDD
jgi:hypothetical protein